VANKFQTGFDQPLLCGMYVDKMLGGIQAVQTLSRLNRAHPGKDTTYILDFVNEAGDILKAFKTYHETAELEAATDPHLVYDLRAKLDATGHYDDFEVDRVAKVDLDPQGTQKQLDAAIAPVADRLLKRYKARSKPGRTPWNWTTTRPPRCREGHARCPRAVQGRHGRLRAPVCLLEPDLRLRQYGHREALPVLQTPHPAAGLRPRTRRRWTCRRWC
jgi:hypothetical protein